MFDRILVSKRDDRDTRSLHVLCVVFFLLLPLQVGAKTINYLVIGTEVEPLQFEKNGSATKNGIITEIVLKIFEDSDFQVEFHLLPWKRQIKYIEQGDVDNWLIYSLPSWLVSDASYSEDLFSWRHVLVSPKNESVLLDQPDSFRDKILVLINHFDYPGLDSWSHNSYFKSTTLAASNLAAIKILKKNWGQVFIGEEGRTRYSMHKLGYQYSEFDFQDFSSVIEKAGMKLAFDPDMPESFLHFVNARIRSLKLDGTIQQILEKYHWSPHVE